LLNKLYKSDRSQELAAISAAATETARLFADVLDKGLSLRVKVTGRSMVPFLKGGEVVTIRKVPEAELRRGDLIFVEGQSGFPVLHRLIRRKRAGKGEFMFQTRGDALRSFDVPVRHDKILGKVCKIERVGPESGSEKIHMEASLQRKMNYIRALVSLFESYCHYGRLRLSRRKLLCRRNT
jgi:signal peptidase I